MNDEQKPAPLTPADCDLQDFGFMPLDVQRLRDSDLAAEQTPEENWAALLLWAASWHQVPAASVPDNDKWLAKHAGYMARGRISKEWETIKPGALRGFVQCSDGRWYHPVVAEKAREAWTSKLKQRLDTEKARIKKHNERHHTQIPYPEFDQWVANGCPVGQPLPVPSDAKDLSRGQRREKHSKGQGEGQGQGQERDEGANAPSSPAKLPPCPHDAIVGLYHEVLPELPQVRLMPPRRKKALEQRWRWIFTSNRKSDGQKRAHTADQALTWLRGYFDLVRGNDFLMGRTPRGAGHENWQCDLDFLLTDRGMLHVIEKTPVQETT